MYYNGDNGVGPLVSDSPHIGISNRRRIDNEAPPLSIGLFGDPIPISNLRCRLRSRRGAGIQLHRRGLFGAVRCTLGERHEECQLRGSDRHRRQFRGMAVHTPIVPPNLDI